MMPKRTGNRLSFVFLTALSTTTTMSELCVFCSSLTSIGITVTYRLLVDHCFLPSPCLGRECINKDTFRLKRTAGGTYPQTISNGVTSCRPGEERNSKQCRRATWTNTSMVGYFPIVCGEGLCDILLLQATISGAFHLMCAISELLTADIMSYAVRVP